MLVGAMAFLAALALAGVVAAAALGEHWQHGAAATITIQVPDPAADGRLDRVLASLRDTPGVEAVQPLSQSEMEALLRPWLGSGAGQIALPLPAVISARLRDTTADTALARQLDAICPESNVSVRHLKKLLEFKGVQGGAHSPAFYAAYVYYEKIRIRQNKNKGKKRQTMEEIWGGKRANSAFLNWHSKGSRLGGFPREGQHKAAMFMSAGDNWSMNQYGQCVLTRRDGRVSVY